MRRYGEPSKNQEPSWPHQFCSDCIIATRGYDFREGHPGTPPPAGRGRLSFTEWHGEPTVTRPDPQTFETTAGARHDARGVLALARKTLRAPGRGSSTRSSNDGSDQGQRSEQNGTAFSAVAPSDRPCCGPSIQYSRVASPQARMIVQRCGRLSVPPSVGLIRIA
jgi:hypothetical protein